jgi:hypothetical protein
MEIKCEKCGKLESDSTERFYVVARWPNDANMEFIFAQSGHWLCEKCYVAMRKWITTA